MEEDAKTYRILVADDEPEVIDLVRMVLEMEGYEMLDAGDGQSALDLARAERPDLVLLDVRMPTMSGLTVLDRLQANAATADIPIIMLSVVTSYPDVRAALQRGAVAYLSKPFEIREMTHLVTRILEMDRDERDALRQRELRHVGKAW